MGKADKNQVIGSLVQTFCFGLRATSQHGSTANLEASLALWTWSEWLKRGTAPTAPTSPVWASIHGSNIKRELLLSSWNPNSVLSNSYQQPFRILYYVLSEEIYNTTEKAI